MNRRFLNPETTDGLKASAYFRPSLSGHTPGFLKVALRRLGLMSKAKAHAQKNNVAFKPLLLTERTELGDGINVYTEVKKTGAQALVIDAHGFPQSAPEFPALKIRGGSVSADLLDYRLRQKNVDLSRYENIRVLSCYPGDGGANSFSTNLASLTGLPVKGYKGKVILRKVGNIHSLEDITLVGFHKENIFRRGGGLYRNFEYSPIWSSAL
ncbi:hypothetical protein JGS08_01260 [Pseudomonas cannabina pv. alisalensis]|nr:hypothetical protein JGS08_01260 [Pseudomonas cannabina pv. alisalensis]